MERASLVGVYLPDLNGEGVDRRLRSNDKIFRKYKAKRRIWILLSCLQYLSINVL
jgi:hypothetical protein